MESVACSLEGLKTKIISILCWKYVLVYPLPSAMKLHSFAAKIIWRETTLFVLLNVVILGRSVILPIAVICCPFLLRLSGLLLVNCDRKTCFVACNLDLV